MEKYKLYDTERKEFLRAGDGTDFWKDAFSAEIARLLYTDNDPYKNSEIQILQYEDDKFKHIIS